MISVTKLRTGVNFEDSGSLWRVLSYKHTHLSRGSGTIKIKCRNLRTGRTLTKTYKSGERVEEIEVDKKPLQYLYKDQGGYVFMDQVSFEQLTIAEKLIAEEINYLKEGAEVDVLFYGDEALMIDLPPKMTFEVTEAAPGERGDSASNVYKDAVLETGLRIRVPLFIRVGEKVRVDTRDGSYIERAN